jgi:hypothetical protein
MEYYLSESSNSISLHFENPILNEIKDLYFKPNVNINYLNKSYICYIYQKNVNNVLITFNGFFKDGYFIILVDSHNETLDVSVFIKNVIITKLEWELKKYTDELFLWKIKTNKKYNYNYFNLNIRDYIEENNDISIDDILSINKCISYNLDLNSSKNKKNKILSMFS